METLFKKVCKKEKPILSRMDDTGLAVMLHFTQGMFSIIIY